jgi:membrane fusion protein (multidrug efflux system)
MPSPRLSSVARRGRPLCLIFSLLLAAACQANAGKDGFGGKKDEKAEKAEEEAIPVVPGVVALGSITAILSVSSTIEAENQVTIHAESTGRIVDLKVQEGQKVKKGESLARIRFDAQASALVRASTSLAKAEEDFARAEQLFADRVIGKEELDRARNSLEMARLDVRDRNREVRNTNIVAPFTGTITQRMVAEGGFVANGAQILTIVDFDSLVARVYVPEKELDQIRVGQVATVVGKAAQGRRGAGVVERIAPVVDASTGTVKVTISLPREIAGPTGFLPGMYAEVTLVTEERQGIPVIPKAAVVHDEEQSFVFVIEGDRARKVKVTLGLQDSVQVEVREGPAVGAEIILAGQAGLKDSAKIARVDAQGRSLAEAAAADKADQAASEGREELEKAREQSKGE